MATIVAEEERLAAVLDHAKNRFFTGQFEDTQAIHRATELGLVGFSYEGVAGFLGLSKLVLEVEGQEWLDARS